MHIAIGLILISALTNALIGAMMKRADDRILFRGIMGGISALILLPALFFVPVPPASIWVWLIIGAGLHFAYQLAQVGAYNRADMSLVYPIMRGIAPALAAGFALIILQEPLSAAQLTGLMISVLALFGFAWPQKKTVQLDRTIKYALGFAVLCGVLTALYTVIDAKGIRLAENLKSTSAIGKASYIVWFFVLDGIGIWAIILMIRGRIALQGLTRKARGGMLPASLNLICYGSALLAFSLAPIAGLAAMRELSIVFGAIIAALWLKESFGAKRIALSIALAFGLILLHWA
ncbi:MAG: DMT family transporter [Litorimonas sp.]